MTPIPAFTILRCLDRPMTGRVHGTSNPDHCYRCIADELGRALRDLMALDRHQSLDTHRETYRRADHAIARWEESIGDSPDSY